jgi:hypothetical protein
MCILLAVPRSGDDKFEALASHVEPPDLSDEADDALIRRARERVGARLTIAVEVGILFGALMDRGWSAWKLERETDLHRRTVARWAHPFRRSTRADQ